MFGQWRGTLTGQNMQGRIGGELLLNIDKDRPDVGRLHVYDGISPYIATVGISVNGTTFTGNIVNVEPFPARLPNVIYPGGGVFSGQLQGTNLSGTWSTNTPSNGSFQVLSAESQPAMKATMRFSWHRFVNWARAKAADTSLIFRGQSSAKHALTTTFHRSGRRDMVRYMRDDVRLLRRSVEAATGSPFRLELQDDLDTLLNIAQHHGFPTPLLDFTQSAFVAAYFAFAGVKTPRTRNSRTRVRIFVLDASVLDTVVPIISIKPKLGRLQLGARLNPRVLPQQSVNVFSDAPDVEGFMALHGQARGRPILETIDLPAAEADVALRDLRRFGISAASLFPGLEGACRGLAEELFP